MGTSALLTMDSREQIESALRLGVRWEDLGELKANVRAAEYNKSSWKRALSDAAQPTPEAENALKLATMFDIDGDGVISKEDLFGMMNKMDPGTHYDEGNFGDQVGSVGDLGDFVGLSIAELASLWEKDAFKTGQWLEGLAESLAKQQAEASQEPEELTEDEARLQAEFEGMGYDSKQALKKARKKLTKKKLKLKHRAAVSYALEVMWNKISGGQESMSRAELAEAIPHEEAAAEIADYLFEADDGDEILTRHEFVAFLSPDIESYDTTRVADKVIQTLGKFGFTEEFDETEFTLQ